MEAPRCLVLWLFVSLLGSSFNHGAETGKGGIADTLFIVITQPNAYHVQKAEEFEQHLQSQFDNSQQPEVIFTHEKWPDSMPWTILSILPEIVAEVSMLKSHRWVFFCEEDTRLDLKTFSEIKQQFDPRKELFLGRALRDKAPTIIHHFAHHDNPGSFAYPDFRAGFLMSTPLILSVARKLETKKLFTDFVIDAKHELATYIWDDGKGVKLTNVPQFCTSRKDNSKCATYASPTFPDCGPEISDSDLYVAVKTCKEFHQTRVGIVKKSWGKESNSIEYVSEEMDASIPTISVGVPNTKSGHCGKTFGILRRAFEHELLKDKKWIAIVDDDTIISLRRLRQLLACYNPDEAVVVGERYGYASYDYITGGGGMIFSRSSVQRLMESDCRCPMNDSPDDMILGMCFRTLGITLTHSSLFHQARPEDYSDGYLGNHAKHISFHKHWETDPVKIYRELLMEPDHHDEL